VLEQLKLNSPVVLGGAVAVLVLIVGYRFIAGDFEPTSSGTPVKSPNRLAWYYDTVAQKVFAAPGKVPPFNNEADHECVQVIMYTCGPCDETNRYVAYYQKLDGSGQPLISPTAEANSWIASNSPEGSKLIRSRTLDHCTDGRPTPCWPKPDGPTPLPPQ